MEIPTYTKKYHSDVYPDIDASHLSVKDKVVVLTGGGTGVGAATAEAFATAGVRRVYILGRTQKTLDAAKTAVSSRHPKTDIIPIVTDITKPESVENAFADIGDIDILINNAAYLSIGTVDSFKVSDWFEVYDTNVKGSLLLVQAGLKHLNVKEGIVINITSGAAHAPYAPGSAAYGSSKMASVKMFEYLQHEKPDLTVYNLHPGIINSTAMAQKATAATGNTLPSEDTVELPANFMVWLSTPEAAFLKGRFLWANWDVKELIEKKKEFEADPTMLTSGLIGWP